LTVRISDDLARRLAIQRAVTGESTNALVVRLVEAYLAGDGRKAVAAAAFDKVDKQYRVALDKLA
jgi:plasmid stability protein